MSSVSEAKLWRRSRCSYGSTGGSEVVNCVQPAPDAERWMLIVLIGFTVRTDLLGVTSFVRCLGLCAPCYDRILDFLHSNALNVIRVTQTWTALVVSAPHPTLLRCNGRVVVVMHPTRGKCILMCTDLELVPIEIIRLYGYRFKIEVSFKQSLHVVGAFLHHFWMAPMTPVKRNGGNQYLHRKPRAYRDAVRRKMDAYHRFMQLGLIAQGIMQVLATTVPDLVWRSFGSWLRTVRPGICPSEWVVAAAMRNSLPEFLADDFCAPYLTKFIRDRLDLERAEGTRLAA